MFHRAFASEEEEDKEVQELLDSADRHARRELGFLEPSRGEGTKLQRAAGTVVPVRTERSVRNSSVPPGAGRSRPEEATCSSAESFHPVQ